MAYTNHHFCWFEITSTDKAAAVAFYPETLGWTTQDVDMGPGGIYTMALGSDVSRAGFADAQGGAPTHWNSYLRVEDVDATTAAAKANGGRVMLEPLDMGGVGRMSIVSSPSGAMFSLFKEAVPDENADAPNSLGGIHWTELHSQDVEADKAWLAATFGYEIGTMPMPDGGTYYLLKTDSESAAGGLMPAMNPEAPSMWLNWVWVDDVDETLVRVTNNGGQVHAPAMDIPNIGRMAVVADPTGGVFGVITPS